MSLIRRNLLLNAALASAALTTGVALLFRPLIEGVLIYQVWARVPFDVSFLDDYWQWVSSPDPYLGLVTLAGFATAVGVSLKRSLDSPPRRRLRALSLATFAFAALVAAPAAARYAWLAAEAHSLDLPEGATDVRRSIDVVFQDEAPRYAVRFVTAQPADEVECFYRDRFAAADIAASESTEWGIERERLQGYDPSGEEEITSRMLWFDRVDAEGEYVATASEHTVETVALRDGRTWVEVTRPDRDLPAWAVSQAWGCCVGAFVTQ